MNTTVRTTLERARARALLPYPWEVGPMAAIFADRSEGLALPWLDPLQYGHVMDTEEQEELTEEFQGALPVATFPAGSRGEGLGPEEEDRHMRRASMAKCTASYTDLISTRDVTHKKSSIHAMNLVAITFGLDLNVEGAESLENLHVPCVEVVTNKPLAQVSDLPEAAVRNDVEHSAREEEASGVKAAWAVRSGYVDKVKARVRHSGKEEGPCIGNLRSSRASLHKALQVSKIGPIVGMALDRLFNEKPYIGDHIHSLVHEPPDEAIDNDFVVEVARAIGSVVGCPDLRRGKDAGMGCEVRQPLLKAWRECAQDPDAQPEAWLQHRGDVSVTHRGE